MRLNRLDLIRYGKFTDRSLAFPRAERDFHLVVGPNEAGKSTLRNAVLDLLFGFPVRTPLDFVHAKSDLRLGASIQNGDQALEFLRLKANKNTLRSPDETILPDTVLDAALGQANKQFFDKMFGLDHPRLVEGGNSILNAQDDVGQVLFQAAAGVASLGHVRDALEEEADSLWAPSRSAKRAYYIARSELDEATEALRAATVRTRDWSEANERVSELDARLQELRTFQAEQLAARARLERMRRVRPFLIELQECERVLAGLGAVVPLPADASELLADAELKLAETRQRLAMRAQEVRRLEEQAGGMEIDRAILDAAESVETLDAARLRLGAHEAGIARCEGQVALLWNEVLLAAGELGWKLPERCALSSAGELDDAAVRAVQARLPGLLARKHVEHLVREHSVLTQSLAGAHASASSRQAEAQALEARLQGLSVAEINPALRSALERALTLGDPEADMRKAQAAVAQAGSSLNIALQQLGTWSRTLAQLRAMHLPSTKTVAAWLSERQELAFTLKTVRQRRDDLEAARRKTALEVEQYRQTHHPATSDDVLRARAERDGNWADIKSGRLALAEAAPGFEARLRAADDLADARHDKAQEAAQLQGLQHKLEQDDHNLADAQTRLDQCEQALAGFEARWQSFCGETGLGGMPLEEMPDWLLQKDRALEAAEALEQALREEQGLRAAQDAVHAELRRTLMASLPPTVSLVADHGFMPLRAQAQSYIREADDARIRRDEWLAQLAQGRPMLEAANQELIAARARLDAWQFGWSEALAAMGLAPDLAVGAVEGALVLMGGIAEKLEQIRQIRVERIQAMRSELRAFVIDADDLVRRLGVASGLKSAANAHDAFLMAQDFTRRLQAARQTQAEATRVASALAAETELVKTENEIFQRTQAGLRPLMERAGVHDIEALRSAVELADQHRVLTERVRAVELRVLQEGDGHGRQQLQDEMDAVDAEDLVARLAALQADISQAAERQSALAVELDNAQRTLDAIAGADAAARAEARRQEALARMSDCAERYIKVFTAARLLRWSIDRYREEKQGPMLSRASAIFAQLSLNSFERLSVDFDRNPMVLEGQRPDGRRVGIAGLSDGTRDQLYLALRLAALELHLLQAPPLPFIADDLFINYDDARSRAGLQALADLSRRTQVIFLSHHDHLTELAREVFGKELNVVVL